MPSLFARVDLSQEAVTVVLDLDQTAGGYSLDIQRSREPVRERDGEGAEVLVYGLGSARRRLTISGTTDRYRLPPSLTPLDLSDTLDALIAWGDGATSTRMSGRTPGLERVSTDLLTGTCVWSFTLEGIITEGLDPVTGETVEPEEPPAP